MNEVKVILFLADNALNKFMEGCDLRHSGKVYITRIGRGSFKTTETVNADYFMRIIQKSKSQPDFWIAAIKHEGILYASPEVTEISDGKNAIFLKRDAA